MADIVLAEVGGATWLINGAQHFDGLMRNALPPSVTIAFVRCADSAEMYALWETRPGAAEAEEDAVPWLVNPAMVRRIRVMLGGGESVGFAPWSVLLDDAAMRQLNASAAELAAKPGARLTVRQFAPADPPAGLADLQRLRFQLAAGALARAGADPATILSETGDAEHPEDADRMLLLIGKPAATGGSERGE